jgi:dTDP-4-dehydrorhamnose 3,5-epimerase
MTQGKLVYVAYGTILSAIVDVRKECCGVNETFLIKDISEAGMKDLLWIPSGYAHGFLVMSAEAVVVYKLTNFYSPEHEEILLWNDPKLAIDWKLDDRIPIMKKQDRDGKLLSEITLL